MQLDNAWTKFRSFPIWAQVLVWIVFAPLLLSFLILRRDPGSVPHRALAAAVLIFGGALWLNVGSGSEPPNDPVAAEDRETVEDEDEPADELEPSPSPSPSPKSKPSPKPKPSPSPSPSPQVVVAAWTVTHIVDGDTLDVKAADGTEERVRVVGIDTPERGECGYEDAAAALSALVMGKSVVLVAGARDDRDRYDRLLRYVDVGTTDAGLSLIEQGLAIARYDSRDGYGRHPREDAYVAADAATDNITCAAPAPPPPAPEPEPAAEPQQESVYYKNCDAARADGAAPVRRGDPGYHHHLDRDGDGSGCE